MTLLPFILVIFAAFLHAAWNTATKSIAHNKAVPYLGFLFISILALPVVLIQPGATGTIVDYWYLFLITGIVHASYYLMLLYAYSRYEISVIYPISRGASIVLPLAFSLVILNDSLHTGSLIGITLIVLGILVKGFHTPSQSRSVWPSILAALGVGILVSSYVVIDQIAISHGIDPYLYIVGMYIVFSAVIAPYIFFGRSNDVKEAITSLKRYSLFIGAASMGAYLLVLIAFSLAPLGLIVALRECSILFVILFSVVFLKEKITLLNIISSLCILIGAICIKTL
ncbi:EamA family transporter [bacterium]|mgnify:CR=1 FL=1|jgi:drug/metabolite transporter (DMT)-like permease|nr:EamA family transporter [bacterium]